MTPQDVLVELLARVGAGQGMPVFVNEEELGQWPDAAVAALKKQKLIVKAAPAQTVVCSGCEQSCSMRVNVPPSPVGTARPFVVCDKRDDINRVAVPVGRVEQWKTSGDLIAKGMAELMGLPASAMTAPEGKRWHVGLLQGKKLKSAVTLAADENLNLLLAGHKVALIEVLTFGSSGLALSKGELIRLVDNPKSNSETESPQQRRERIERRLLEVKAQGVKAFLQAVAGEEGLSVQRIKQLRLSKPKIAAVWAGLQVANTKGTGLKRGKTKR